MKKLKFITLLASIALVIVLLLTGCGAAETVTTEKTVTKTVTETVTADKSYKCLNPQGNFTPIEIYPLAPRLDTFEGKTIFFSESEANPRIMPALLRRLQDDYPNTTFPYTAVAGFGNRSPTEEELQSDAAIRGIAW